MNEHMLLQNSGSDNSERKKFFNFTTKWFHDIIISINKDKNNSMPLWEGMIPGKGCKKHR